MGILSKINQVITGEENEKNSGELVDVEQVDKQKRTVNIGWIAIVIVVDELLKQFIPNLYITGIVACLVGFGLDNIPKVRAVGNRLFLILLPIVLGRVFFFRVRGEYSYWIKLGGGILIFVLFYVIRSLFKKYGVPPDPPATFIYQSYWRYGVLIAVSILLYDLDVIRILGEWLGWSVNTVGYYTINTTINILLIFMLLSATLQHDIKTFSNGFVHHIFIGLKLFLAFFLFNIAVSTVIATAIGSINAYQSSLNDIFTSYTTSTIFYITVVTAPFREEIIYRLCFFGLLRKYPLWLAVAVSSVYFALGHISLQAVINQPLQIYFLLPYLFSAICFGAIYLRTKNIFYPILFHALNNLIGILLSANVLFAG